MYRLAGLLVSLMFALLGGAVASEAQSTTLLSPASARIAIASPEALPFTTSIAPAGGTASPVTSSAKLPRETIAAGHLVVIYRGGALPQNVASITAKVSPTATTHLAHLGISTLEITGDVPAAVAELRAQPEVAAVLQDRIVRAHRLEVTPVRTPAHAVAPSSTPLSANSHFSEDTSTGPLGRLPVSIALPAASPSTGDLFYDSPQGWAVLQAGGFGDNIPGGPSSGPWTTSLGAGTRIAILDTGVDPSHPDIAPNLALNLTETDAAAYPTPCDDGSPIDQDGHGTFTASLAAGAIGPSTGEVIGVAPQAALLNIKVMQRRPAATGATQLAQCEAGEGGGLLSWVLVGLDDAIANHADIVSLSLGTLVDLTTGDGAGWKAQFDSVTYAAQQAGIVIVAALGNDGLDLSGGRYAELPAQARGVLPVTASTNPACAENLNANATCQPGPATRASYSNYGATGAIAAPGGNLPEGGDYVVSGLVRGACASGLPHTADGLPALGASFGCFTLGHTAYVQAMGTSAAAPLAAGAAAILHAAHSDWSAARIVASLQTAAVPQTALPGAPSAPALNLPAALAMR